MFAALVWNPFWFHIDYFTSPGPQFRPAILAILPLLLAFAIFYPSIRTKPLRRIEALAPASAIALFAVAKEPWAVAVVALMLVSSFSLGSVFRKAIREEPGLGAGDVALLCGLGVGIWIPALTALGVAGLFRPWIFALLLVAPLAVRPRSLSELWRAVGSVWMTWITDDDFGSPLVGVGVLFGSIFLLITAMVALAPSVAYDSIAMHLPEIRHYLAAGRLEPVPGLDYSYFPQGHELILTMAHGLAGQAGAQLAGTLFFGLACGAAYAFARELGASRGAACFGVFIAATIPFIHWTGSVVKNDFTLVLFHLCSFCCLLRLRKSPRWQLFAAGAFFLGASFAIKHVALFGAIPLGFLYLRHLKRTARPWLTALAMAALFALPTAFWYGRAFVEKGNPVFPAGVILTVAPLPSIGGKSFARATLWLAYPWIAHFDGRTVFESPSPNPYGFTLYLLFPLWLLTRRKARDADERICIGYLAVYYLYWTYVWGVGRYGMPLLFVYAALIAQRALALHDAGARAIRWSLRTGVAFTSAFAMLVMLIVEVNLPQLRYLAGALDKSGYLKQALVGYASLEFLDGIVRPGERVLSLDNCARAYAPDPSNYICLGVPPRRADQAPGLLAGRLQRERFDYLLLPSTATEGTVVAQLGKQWPLEKIYTDDASSIYRVGPSR